MPNVDRLINQLAANLKEISQIAPPPPGPVDYYEATRPPTAEEAKTAIEECNQTCPGPEKCHIAGNIFVRNRLLLCTKYKAWSANQRAQTEIDKAVPLSLAKASFDSYTPENDSQRRALAVSRRFFEKEAYMGGKGIIFLGPNGIGKTHLGVSIFRELIRLHIPTVFARPKTSGAFQEIEAYYRRLEEPKVLIYDDLGTELRKDFIVDLLFGLLDKRAAEGKSLVATSNLMSKDFAAWIGPRIVSRLAERNYFLEMDGEDHRLKNRDLF